MGNEAVTGTPSHLQLTTISAAPGASQAVVLIPVRDSNLSDDFTFPIETLLSIVMSLSQPKASTEDQGISIQVILSSPTTRGG